jgi:hypothetical protein
MWDSKLVITQLWNFIYLIEAAPWNIGKQKKVLDVAGVLFAYVARDSLEADFDGFVAFHSKTVLVEHYIEKYGAKIIRGDQLMFDTSASVKLVEEYLVLRKAENYLLEAVFLPLYCVGKARHYYK